MYTIINFCSFSYSLLTHHIFFIYSNNVLNNKEISNDNQEQSNNKTNEEEIIDTYIDENPVKVALYENNKIVKNYNTTLSNYKDIAVFDIYYTNDEETTERNTKSNYLKYYNMYEFISNVKTGFYFEFSQSVVL